MLIFQHRRRQFLITLLIPVIEKRIKLPPENVYHGNQRVSCYGFLIHGGFSMLYPICEPWCWNMYTNICPCPKSPSHVGFYIPAPWFAYGYCSLTPYAPWCWYIYLHLGDFVRANVGKYSSTMVRIWITLQCTQGGSPKICASRHGAFFFFSTSDRCLVRLWWTCWTMRRRMAMPLRWRLVLELGVVACLNIVT